MQTINAPIGEVIVSPINPRRLDPNNLSPEDEAKIEELRQSIAEQGVVEPGVGRRTKDGKRIELGVGQRRLIASRRAGLKDFPVIIRELTDHELLELALTEQLQREDLHPLDESAAYEELLGSPAVASEHEIAGVAKRIGKSPSYVRRRLQLQNLAPKISAAYRAGDLDFTGALELARVPSTKMQEAAYKALDGRHRDDEPLHARDVAHEVRRKYHLPLSKAPFILDDGTLVPGAGGCSSCPKNTGVQRELFAGDVEGEVCTDPDCYQAKVDAWFEEQAKKAKAVGQHILSKKEASTVFVKESWQHEAHLRHGSPYVELDGECREGSYGSPLYGKPWSKVLGEHAPKPVLAQAPDGTVRKLLPRTAALAALKQAHPKTAFNRPGSSSSKPLSAKEREKRKQAKSDEKLEHRVGILALAALVRALQTKKPDVAIWALLADHALDEAYPLHMPPEVGAELGVEKWAELAAKVPKMTEGQLRAVVVAAHLARGGVNGGADVETVEARRLLQACGVDVKAIEKAERAKLEPAPKAAAKKPAKKKSKARV